MAAIGPDGPQSNMKLIHNAIIKAKFYRAGDEIPNEIVPPQLRRYAAKEVKESAEPKEINLMYQHNKPYSVDANGFLRSPVQRQMAEMQVEAEETDSIVDEIAEAPLDEQPQRLCNKRRKTIRLM